MWFIKNIWLLFEFKWFLGFWRWVFEVRILVISRFRSHLDSLGVLYDLVD